MDLIEAEEMNVRGRAAVEDAVAPGTRGGEHLVAVHVADIDLKDDLPVLRQLRILDQQNAERSAGIDRAHELQDGRQVIDDAVVGREGEYLCGKIRHGVRGGCGHGRLLRGGHG
jgi:hypothetical protein